MQRMRETITSKLAKTKFHTNVEKFTFIGKILTCKNCVRGKVRGKVNSGNSFNIAFKTSYLPVSTSESVGQVLRNYSIQRVQNFVYFSFLQSAIKHEGRTKLCCGSDTKQLLCRECIL